MLPITLGLMIAVQFVDLTIVIPVKNPPDLEGFIQANLELLKENNIIVIDSGGGEPLKSYCKKYIKQDLQMWEARKLGYTEVETTFTLNLDCDVIVSLAYIKNALQLLRDNKAEAVSIHFAPVKTGHLEFGASIWNTEVLRKLYDYPPKPVEKLIKVGKQEWVTAFQHGFCECSYMWRKLLSSGGRLETLSYRAIHLK